MESAAVCTGKRELRSKARFIKQKQARQPFCGLPCPLFIRRFSSFAVLLVWIPGASRHRFGNAYLQTSQRKQIIRTRLPQGRFGSDYLCLVPVAGVEPARGISPMDFEFCTLSGTGCTLVDYIGFCLSTNKTKFLFYYSKMF